MRPSINEFIEFISRVRGLGKEINYIEEMHRIDLQISCKFDVLTDFFSEGNYGESLDQNIITFRFTTPIKTYTDGEFHSLIKNKKVVSEQLDEITLRITATKKKVFDLDNNELIFLEIDSFRNCWNLLLGDFVEFFGKTNKSRYIYLYLPVSHECDNGLLKILPHDEFKDKIISEIDITTKEDIESIFNEREENSNLGKGYPIPQYFKFSEQQVDKDILQVLNKTLFISCLRHLVNKAENRNILVLKGQTSISIELTNEEVENALELFLLIEDIYKIKRYVKEKLHIFRHVFSLYFNSGVGLADIDKEIISIKETCFNHFAAYLDDQVTNFLKNTKDAIDEVRKYAKEASEAVDKIKSHINASLLAGITAFLTSAFAMSQRNFMLLLTSIILFTAYIWVMFFFNRKHSYEKKKYIESMYDLSVRKTPLVTEKERTDIKNSFLKPELDNIDIAIKENRKFNIYFSALALIVLIVMSVYIIHEKKKPVEDQQPTKIYFIRADKNDHGLKLI